MSAGSGSRGHATACRISVHAVRLTGELGFDGFTMDQLAAEAGVSRRTLFNHFASKVDAVLGPTPDLGPELRQRFRDGGPHGDLVQDLAELAREVLRSKTEDRLHHAVAMRSLLHENPRLLAAAHQRFVGVLEELTAEIEVREGEAFVPLRALVALRALVSLFDLALERWFASSGSRDLVDEFDDALATAYALFLPR